MQHQIGKNIDNYMGGCHNYGPFLGTLNIRCRTKKGDPKRDHNFDNHPKGSWDEVFNHADQQDQGYGGRILWVHRSHSLNSLKGVI